MPNGTLCPPPTMLALRSRLGSLPGPLLTYGPANLNDTGFLRLATPLTWSSRLNETSALLMGWRKALLTRSVASFELLLLLLLPQALTNAVASPSRRTGRTRSRRRDCKVVCSVVESGGTAETTSGQGRNFRLSRPLRRQLWHGSR